MLPQLSYHNGYNGESHGKNMENEMEAAIFIYSG